MTEGHDHFHEDFHRAFAIGFCLNVAFVVLEAVFGILAGSLAVLIGGNMLVAVTGFPEPEVAWRPILLDVGLVGFMASLAMSVLHGERNDPGRVLRLFTSWAAVTTIGLFAAAGLEALFSGGLVGAVSLRHGVGSAVAFAVVLATYRQLAGWVSRLLPL